MSEGIRGRRAVLSALGTGLLALAGCVSEPSEGADPDTPTPTDRETDTPTPTESVPEAGREVTTMMDGTEYETAVYHLRSGVEGPTAVVLGGVHGNEVGGIEAAHVATGYEVGSGTVVVVPETNRPAVEAKTRYGPDGDLNRQFPVGEEPETEIAEAVWELLLAHEPDLLIDMHTSRGVYGLHEETVGQVLFPSPVEGATEDAYAAAESVNGTYLDDLLGDELHPAYAFEPVYSEDAGYEPEFDGILVLTAGFDLSLKGWVTEVTYRGFDVDEQAFLHDRLTTALLRENGIEVESPFDATPNPLLG
ncbi:M99 family carboxypeptidase catalytic domain-containing protein [Natronorarus salvus]|uniref:M99 family carboxypeptidase catalytic domain-containing protein n=1 Tax=Natronorarus salvus TaxID=3117733 RepID=UPI002F26B83C